MGTPPAQLKTTISGGGKPSPCDPAKVTQATLTTHNCSSDSSLVLPLFWLSADTNMTKLQLHINLDANMYLNPSNVRKQKK